MLEILKTKLIIADNKVPKKVIQHIQNNLVLSTDESSICVDGGYTKEQASGELARPGGDLGLSMLLLALGFSPQEAFDLVLNFRLSRNQKYGWHTDTHEGHHGLEIGCGHCNASILNAQYYGVSPQIVKELLVIIRKYQKNHSEKMRFITLDREHQEEGIFVVNTPQITLQPWDQENHSQFFVYDQARDQQLIKDLWQFINQKESQSAEQLRVGNKNYTFKDFQKLVDQHTMVTLALLASSQGKPMYEVKLDPAGDQLIITRVGNAPTKESLTNKIL